MPTTTDLENKLLASASVATLQAELEVGGAFFSRGWHAEHGAFYDDRITRKPREVDILAQLHFHRKQNRAGHECRIEVVAEVKSLGGYHIVFPSVDQRERSDTGVVYREWIGYLYESRRFKRLLRKEGLNTEQIVAACDRATSIAFPRGRAAPRRLMCDPPPAPWNATSFKETNTEKERDLDSSALWKAWQQVESAVRSIRATNYRVQLGNTAFGIEYDLRAGENPLEWVEINARMYSSMVVQYHPLIVLDARLWALAKPNRLQEVEWFRLILLRARGQPLGWVDVVTRKDVANYVKATTAYYRKHYRRVGARCLTKT